MPSDTLFVGIGSDHGDDRVGWLVADELVGQVVSATIIRRAKSPLDLLDWLEGIRCLAICDACRGAGPIGSWRRWRWPRPDPPLFRSSGSHALGLVDTLQLALRLGVLPEEVLLWGVEIGVGQPGDRLSAEVAAAISPVAHDVASVLRLRQAA